jgi:hypothetical protein
VEQREFLQPSSNILYGLSSPNGYANLTPNYIVDIWGDQNRPGLITQTASIAGGYFAPAPLFWKLMRMYNVKYLTSFWPFAASPHLVPIGIYGEAFLYRNDDLLPRAYLVGEVVSVADEAAALAMLRTDGFAPERSVLLEEMPPDYQPGTRAGGSVEFLHYTTNQAVLRVVTAGAGILVFSDSYYPGWRAEVDGQETRIYRANVTQRAVLVPAGQHRVTFAFRPTTVAVGFWISMGTLLVLLGCFVLPLVTTKKIFGKTKPNNPLPA